MPLNFATKAFFTLGLDFEPASVVNCTIFCFHACALANWNLDFLNSFPILSRFFCFPFSLPFYFLYLLPFIPFLFTGKGLASALQKTWKWNIDRLDDLAWPIPLAYSIGKLHTYSDKYTMDPSARLTNVVNGSSCNQSLTITYTLFLSQTEHM